MPPSAIQSLVIRSIRDLNRSWNRDVFAHPGPDTLLFHRDSPMDSMQLVQLVAHLEEVIAEETGRSVTLADERAMSQQRSPFRSVGSLTDYIESLLQEDRRVEATD